MYWANHDGTQAIYSLPKANLTATPQLLWSGPTTPTNATSLAVSPTAVFWTNNCDGCSVLSVPIGGGSPTTIATEQPSPYGLAVDGNHVYWTVGTTGPNSVSSATMGALMRATTSGGSVTTLASNLQTPSAVVVGSGSVFFSTSSLGENEGNIWKLTPE